MLVLIVLLTRDESNKAVGVDAAAARGEIDYSKNYDRMPTRVIWAVPGKDIELPCDVTPPLPSDAVHMVFWFKDSMVMPLYSLDARGGPLSKADHFASSDDLGTRSYFIITEEASTARLKVKRVSASDEGIFRCRVDFINSPTRNFRFNLTLVDQPSKPRIFDAQGKEIISVAGPFLEGHELFLSCEATGGRPAPNLVWYYNGTILDAVIDTKQTSSATVNQLFIARVDRSMKGARLECRASAASEIAGEIIREVPITVYLKPNKVKITTSNKLLASNSPTTVKCETSGSYPPALLTWLLDGKPIRNGEVTEEETMKSSRSILTFSPFPTDDGKELICRADNPRFPGGSLIDRRYIKVAYPPIRVTVQLAPNTVNPVTEGSSVTIQCNSEATPPAHSYNWYFKGHILLQNETAGVVPLGNQLNLTQITRLSEGEYSCAAFNTEGDSYSGPFQLKVQYAPRCAQGHALQRVGTIAHESVAVECHVDAEPAVTRFHWTYNTSRGVSPVQGAKQQNQGGVSTLHFTVGAQEVDSLACWATNDVGRQVEPCLFYIVPAFKPEPPRNCLLQNSTSGGLEVACTAGRDGGLQQSFVLEVIESFVVGSSRNKSASASNKKMMTNSSLDETDVDAAAIVVTTLSDQEEYTPLYRVLEEKPLFRLQGLQADREYQLLVYAENAKGRSQPPVLLSNVRVYEDSAGDDDSRRRQGQHHQWGLSGGLGDATTDSDSDSSKSILSSAPTLTLILLSLALLAFLLILSIVTAATILACRRCPSTAQQRVTPQLLQQHQLSGTDGLITIRRSRRSSKPPEELELQSEVAGFNDDFHRRSAQYRASVYALQVDGEAIYGRQVSTGPDLILAPATFTQPQF